MSEREAKRIRQACQNCRYARYPFAFRSPMDRWMVCPKLIVISRRKKTRCSGERPICAFCARLQQDCIYDDFAFFSVDGERSPSHQRQQPQSTYSGTERPPSIDPSSSSSVSSTIFLTPSHTTADVLSSLGAPGRRLIRKSCYARVSAQHAE
jgi:hypothetical protein